MQNRWGGDIFVCSDVAACVKRVKKREEEAERHTCRGQHLRPTRRLWGCMIVWCGAGGVSISASLAPPMKRRHDQSGRKRRCAGRSASSGQDP